MTPLYTEADLERDAVVEPWHPRIGDRVRIRITPECDACSADGARAVFDVTEGVVIACYTSGGFPCLRPERGHNYPVYTAVARGHFAAAELQPLEPA